MQKNTRDKEHKIYMSNVNPTLNYIPLAGFGFAMVCVGSAIVRIGSMNLFRYQHVGIGNANHLRWGVGVLRVKVTQTNPM